MTASWIVRQPDASEIERLSSALGLSPVLAHLLLARGIGEIEAAQRFLDPRLQHLRSPASMAGLSRAAERLAGALADDQRIGVFGDYDVDGVSSAALVADYLRRCGATVVAQAARRDEGYGFNRRRAEDLLGQGCQVIVLTDCGTGDVEAVAYATSAGADVIAVDHHRVTETEWPGHTLVNPQRFDCAFPYKGLCSGGLAFYLTAALRREVEGRKAQEGLPDPRDNLDLVALATVADVAPLEAENRILVARGLDVLARTTRPGLRHLLRLSGIEGRPPTADDIGWRLAPRLNAAGRLGDASIALECLCSRDEAVAARSARLCDELNQRRKGMQEQILAEALKQAEGQQAGSLGGTGFCLVAQEGWHPGIIGIVAAKLSQQLGRPAAVVALDGDEGRGSARTIDGVDLFALFQACSAHLIRFGGHGAAAGFTVARRELEALREQLDALANAARQQVEVGRLTIDGLLDLAAVTFDLCADLDRLGPYGQRNPAPVFAAPAVRVEEARPVGADHILVSVRQGSALQQAIGFGMLASLPRVGDRVDIAFVPFVDDYGGRRLRLRLVKLVPAGEGIGGEGRGA